MSNADKPDSNNHQPAADEPRPVTHHDNLRPGAWKDGAPSRREFLGYTALGAAGLIMGPRLLAPEQAHAGPGRSRRAQNAKIVRAHHPAATSHMNTVHQEPVDDMVHAAIRELTGIGDTAAAWASLFPDLTVSKKIAIKINLACGDVPTHPQVINAIIDGILMVDIGGQTLPEENIIVWDLDNAFLCAQTGYVPNWGGPGVQYVGTDHPSVGFDMLYAFPISHPDDSTTYHHPSRILTQHCDYLINAAVIKDHSDSEVTLCLKNHYGSFDNIAINELHQHWYYGDGHERGEPELNRVLRDELGDKTVLYLIDATLGLYDGGPGYIPPWHTPPNWAYNSLLAGFDPVAIDRIGTEKLTAERLQHGIETPLDPSHVRFAAQPPYELGTDDLAEIDLVEIDASTAVQPDAIGVRSVALLAPYPNPTQSSSTVRFRCGTATEADLRIVDVRGRQIRQLATGAYAPGTHRFLWDGRDDGGRAVPSGVYFCLLDSQVGVQRRRVTLVR